MFEIYKDDTYNEKYEVIYYTELDEDSKYTEIQKAFSGTSYYNGYIGFSRNSEAKKIINSILDKLNNGVQITEKEIGELLKEYTPL